MQRNALLAILSEEIASRKDDLKFSLPGDPPGYVRIYVPDRMHELIAAIPEVRANATRWLNHGRMSATLHPYALGQAVLDRAIKETPEKAVDDLYEFLKQDYLSCIELCVLTGIKVVETTEILPGVFLSPLSLAPLASLRAHASSPKSWPPVVIGGSPVQIEDRRVVPESALYRKLEIRPKWLEPRQFPPEYDGIPLATIASLLTLVGPSSPFVTTAYTELEDDELLKGRVGVGWQSGIEETRVVENVAVSAEDIAALAPVIRSYTSLPPGIRQKLQVPLHRLNEAVRHRGAVDRALDLGIALESLLLSGQRSKDQLALQFRLRGAWLLGNNGPERTHLHGVFQRLYEYRSAAAHTGVVEPKKTTPEQVSATLQEGLRLCAAGIRKVIEHGGPPAWDELLVGAGYTIEHEQQSDD
jgi:hypothetical protein